MISIIIVSSIFLFVFWRIIDSKLRYKRQIHVNNLLVIYDKIEILSYVLKLNPDNNLIRLLTFYKTLQTNDFLADIRVALYNKIMLSEESLSKSKEAFQRDTKNLPKEILNLIEEFNDEYYSIIRISLFKISFLKFVFKIIVINFYRKRHTKIIVMYKELKEVFRQHGHSLFNYLRNPELNFA